MGFTDGTRRPKVSSLKLIWLTTLIFCLRHRCTKNQSLQVFGRVEQGIKSLVLRSCLSHLVKIRDFEMYNKIFSTFKKRLAVFLREKKLSAYAEISTSSFLSESFVQISLKISSFLTSFKILL
jgi:hypothetical protein